MENYLPVRNWSGYDRMALKDHIVYKKQYKNEWKSSQDVLASHCSLFVVRIFVGACKGIVLCGGIRSFIGIFHCFWLVDSSYNVEQLFAENVFL